MSVRREAEITAGRADVLNRLPQVRWDRCVRWDGCMSVFGWIDRDDGRSDFVTVLFLWPGEPFEFMWTTSSAEQSEAIAEALCGTAEGHVPCERATSVFGALVPRALSIGGET